MKKKNPDKNPAQTGNKAIRFLVVEDDLTVRNTIAEYLSSFGYAEVIQVSNAESALETLNSMQIDFVISDWEMPGKSGLDLLRFIRGHQTFRRIPFIMITSQVSQEKLKIKNAVAFEVNAYIVKPFRAQVLKEKIESLIPKTFVEKNFTIRKAALIVDDDTGVLGVMTEYLKELGYENIYTANDGAQAFTLLEEKGDEIAFVLSDWDMPHLAGIDLLRKIRLDPRFNALAFVMMTSPTSMEKIKIGEAIDSEVDQYLLKPIRIDDLRIKIELALQKSKLLSEVNDELDHANTAANCSQWADSERAYNHVIKLQPTNTQAHIGLAKIQTYLDPERGFDKAIRMLTFAIKMDPKCLSAYMELAFMFEKTRSLDKAISYLQSGVKICPASEKLHFNLGRLLVGRGKQDLGLLHLKRALELNPKYAEAREFVASITEKAKGG